MKKIWNQRKRVIFTWIFSYVIVLLIPVAMSLVIYEVASGTLKDEIRRSNDALLQQLHDQIDVEIGDMIRLSNEMIWNSTLQNLLYFHKPEGEETYLAYQLVKDFGKYQNYYPTVDQYFVIWKKESAVLLPGTVWDMPLLHPVEDTSWWSGLLDSPPGGSFIRMSGLDSGKAGNSSLVYVTPLSTHKGGEVWGAAVVGVDTGRIMKAVSERFGGARVYVLNLQNQVLVSNDGTGAAPPLSAMMEEGKKGAIYNGQEDKNKEVFYIHSDISGLKYVSVIPARLYWEKSEYIRRFTWISIMLSLIGAGLVTVFFAKRNYSPIRRLIAVFSGSPGADEEIARSGELNFIHRAITNSLSEREQIQLQLERQNNMLRSNMLTRLLMGKIEDSAAAEEGLKKFGIAVHSEDFAVLLIYVENYEAIYSGFADMAAREKHRLLQFIITNVMEEMVRQNGHYGYIAEVDDMLGCIINFSGGAANAIEAPGQIADSAQRFLLQKYGIELTLSISRIHRDYLGIAEAYQEALDAMEYKMLAGRQKILFYEEVSRQGEGSRAGYYYPLKLEMRMVNFIKTGDYPQAQRLLGEIAERNREENNVSLTLSRCLVFNLIGTIVKTVNEIDGSEGGFLAGNPGWMDEVISRQTLDEIYEQLDLILQQACLVAAERRQGMLKSARATETRELMDQVKSFVQEHYADPNLNISWIGDRFRLNAGYLSKLFKEYSGEGLLDYINKCRIANAKTMLLREKLPILEVARKVGYSEAASFIRIFKKYEGITPGKYKEIEGEQAG